MMLYVATLHFCACSENKNRLQNYNSMKKIQGFVETLQIISFQNALTITKKRYPHLKKSHFLVLYEILLGYVIHLYLN